MFLSLFNSLVGALHADVILLQDPPSSKGFLPRFTGFKSFAPPTEKPRVAIYISLRFCTRYTILPGFQDDTTDAMYLDIYTPDGCFGTSAPKFRLNNIYARETGGHARSVSPEVAFQQVDFPYLVAGDFNIDNPASDPLRVFSYSEELESAPFYSLASDRGFRLLNTPGVYTRFPLSGFHRPSAIDLSFSNPLMSPAFVAWDTTSLPSTGSDHVPVLITLAPPTDKPMPRTPCWDLTDWEALRPRLQAYCVPPAPLHPSPTQLNEWFSSSLNSLTALLMDETPLPRPSRRSTPWWTPLLTVLRKEYHKAMPTMKKHPSDDTIHLARLSKLGYFKAIKRAKGTYWSNFLGRTTPQNIWTAKQYVAPRKTPRFPSLPGASTPTSINDALLQHFFPPKPPPPARGRLYTHANATPLFSEEIKQALSKCSPSSAPGPDGIPYRVWKRVNTTKPTILLELLSPLVALGYHPPCLKHANGVILDKPGKPSYDTPPSFRIIVLLKTISKILERIMTVRLSDMARRAGILHPNQCGSLPGLSTSDACATLIHEVRTLQRPRWAVSTLFLDIKAGFDNVNASKLRSLLLDKNIPSYMEHWVTSFLSERSCTLVFQGAPGTVAPVEVGTPQGSPISPLLFLIYVAPLHSAIPRGVMLSYVDDFSLTVALNSYRTNIRRLQDLFRTLTRRGDRLEVKFLVPKTELIHWRTPSQRSPPSQAHIALDGLIFHPAGVVRWLGYWLSLALNSQHHFAHRVSLAQASFSFVKRLSSPGAEVRPFLNHCIALGLLLPILTYGSDLLVPNAHSLGAMNSFWHRTCRWVTNCFFTTTTSILTREACLPPIAAYCRYRRKLAALRIACAPPSQNPAAARLPTSFPSLSVFRAQDSSRHLTRGLSSVYLPLNWRSAVPTPPLRKHLPIDAMAHLLLPLIGDLSRLPMVLHAPPPPGTDIPPPRLMIRTYLALKKRARDALLDEWATLHPAPDYYPYPPRLTPPPFMGLDKFVAGRIHQMRAGKSYLAAHPSCWSELPNDTCPRSGSGPESFTHAIFHCPKKNRESSLLLGGVTSLDEGSPLWSTGPLTQALGQFITATHTGFPREMRPPSPGFPPSPASSAPSSPAGD